MTAMEKIGNIYFLKKEKGDLNFLDPGCKDLKHSILICLSVIPNPELFWPDEKDKEIVGHYRAQLSSLYALGMFDWRIQERVKGHAHHIDLAIEYQNIIVARRAFEEATNVGRIVDIYLYDNGRLVAKLD